MSESGPAAAIETCRLEAPVIAARVSAGALRVGRTASRVRNPDNAPDSWEQRILADFDRRLAAGEQPGRMETFAIRNDGRRRYGHWMKAIPTQQLCTACHGTDLAPQVARAIDEAYPRDRARGFEAGQLRGGFSVELELGQRPGDR